MFFQVLFRAYFADGQNITDENVLRQLLAEVGLDEEKALATLADTEAVREYEEEVRQATRKGEPAVPSCCSYSSMYTRTLALATGPPCGGHRETICYSGR